jgi:large subunit ribosomal protein L4
VRTLARRSAFNTRAQNEQVSVIERFDVNEPKTRRVTELLDKIGLRGRKVLILTAATNEALYLSVRNLQGVRVLPFRDASVYDVMNATDLLIEEDALNGATERSDDA